MLYSVYSFHVLDIQYSHTMNTPRSINKKEQALANSTLPVKRDLLHSASRKVSTAHKGIDWPGAAETGKKKNIAVANITWKRVYLIMTWVRKIIYTIYFSSSVLCARILPCRLWRYLINIRPINIRLNIYEPLLERSWKFSNIKHIIHRCIIYIV